MKMPRRGIGRERVHGGEHARAHEEGAQQREREGRDGEQHRPRLERAALLSHRERVDQRGADEPGHERGVLDRIPEPPAAPAQLVVRPPRADHDAQREEHPRERGPGTRPARPRRVQPAAEQRRDREREGDREADVAHVEHRRVEHHARVLQQRVEVAALGGHREQPVERVGGDQHEQQEADGDEAHHAEHARHHLVGQVLARQRHGDRPPGEHEHPQQHRALVRAPGGRDPVGSRQLRVRVRRDVDDREVVDVERPREAAPREGDEQELALRDGTSQRHPGGDALVRAHERQRGEHHRQQQREDEGEVAEFGDHGASPKGQRTSVFAARFSADSMWALSTAAWASGGM